MDGFRGDFPGNLPVDEKHPELDRKRRQQEGQGGRCHFDPRRMDQALEGELEKIEPDGDDDDRHDQPRDIFEPSVPERMFVVGRLVGEFEAEQRDDRRSRVGEIVHRVRAHRDASGQDSDRDLDGAQHEVGQNSIPAAENAVGGSAPRRRHVTWIPQKKPDQQFIHDFSFACERILYPERMPIANAFFFLPIFLPASAMSACRIAGTFQKFFVSPLDFIL